MSGPARAGLSVYAADKQHVARFYEAVAGMKRLHQSAEVIVLQSPDIQLVVLEVPEANAAPLPAGSPPQRRDSALKFFFTVPSIDAARATAEAMGGAIFPDRWQGPGFVVANACDPEGNVFHIRESVA